MTGPAVPPRLVRAVAAFAVSVSLVLATALPTTYFLVVHSHALEMARLEARLDARAVSTLIARNPSYWQFEAVRIAALLGDRNAGRPDEVRRLLDLAGNVIVELPHQVPAPTWTTREPLLDAGQRVGDLEIIRSLRSLLIETAVIAVAAAALALAAFLALRVLPLRLLQRALERATHLATHDALTGLPNRAKFHERLDLLRIRARRQGGLVALIMVDLDRFKPVNDVYGHAAGDLLLQQVAERLVASLRETDTVARIGGDEFCMAAHIEDDDGEGSQRLTRRIVTAIAAPFHLGVHTVQIGCSLGVTLTTDEGMAAEVLMGQADAALYRAKADGRNCFRFFEVGMDAKIRERGKLEAELRVAITQDELVPHYQPLVELSNDRLTGFEMLARWPHPQRGLVPPDVFVPIAEDAGLIVAMTERLLRRACREAATWPDHLTLAVNVSPVQLRDRGLPDMIRQALADSGLPARQLEIELTESALLVDFDLARQILFDLKAIGVRLVLDDFGTGYSSLKHLHVLPIDKLKIDSSFIRSMQCNAASRTIIAAIAGLGHSLGIPSVAEGIEDSGTAAALTAMGCDVGQGWLYGRAVAAKEVQVMLAGLGFETTDIPLADVPLAGLRPSQVV